MSNDNRTPLISVGMPVRNEARFLRQALEALVCQQGVDFEIIISDNASDDGTRAICEEFCSRYPFVTYHRFERNVGPSNNFKYVLEQARGKYYMWASGHDLWDRNYLQACANQLDTHPGATIAFGMTAWIDENGAPHKRITGYSDTRGLSVLGRYFTVFWGSMNPIVGLIRTPALKAQQIDDMVGIDLVMLLNLCMRGDFVHASGTSWYRREFRHEASYSQKLKRYRSADFAWGSSFLWRYFPLARLPARIFGDLFRSPLHSSQKFLIALILLASMPIKYWVDKTQKRIADDKNNEIRSHQTNT